MTRKELQNLLSDVDPELFGFIWGLFDTNGDGFVHADDFIAAMALLTTSADPDVSIEEQMRACFVMFDTRGNGNLSYTEFRSMIEATVTLNLRRILLTDTGRQHVEAHMEREYSKENLTFWQEARSYRTAVDRMAEAKRLIERYILPGAEEEVNLASHNRTTLLATFEALNGAAPPEDLFAAAEEEIFKLMERDAFARFKGDAEAVGAVVDELFASAGAAEDGTISFTEYRKWVLQQPQVIVFFSQLAQSILALLHNAQGANSAVRNSLSILEPDWALAPAPDALPAPS